MNKKNAMIFIVIGIFLTIAGIVFTGVGTYLQNQETRDFQNTITSLSTQISEKQDEISEYSKENVELAEKLALQTEKSNNELTQLSNRNVELTQKLTEISEERFRKLTIPSMNVLRIEEKLDLGVNSYLKIITRNTGNNDCLDACLLVDRHNSPSAKPGFLPIQNFTKVPKDAVVEYKIPLFQSESFASVANDDQKKEFSDFYNRYNDDKTAIVILFHFEYKWNNETLKSSQYSIVKTKNRQAYASSSEDYVEDEI